MRRFSALIASFFVSASFLPAYFPTLSAAAEDSGSTTYPVELTSAQTLGLYGTSLPALWYNGASVSTVSFDFYKSSRQVVDELKVNYKSGAWLSGVVAGNPAAMINMHWRCSNSQDFYSDWFSYPSAEVFAPYEFLIYRAQISPPVIPDSSYDFQLNFDFSINLDGVIGFRQAIGYSSGTFQNSSVSMQSQSACGILSSRLPEFDLYSSSDPLHPVWTSICFRNGSAAVLSSDYHNAFSFFVGNALGSDFGTVGETGRPSDHQMTLGCYPCPNCALLAADYHTEEPVSLARQTLNIRDAQSVVTKIDGSGHVTENGVEFSMSDPYVYIFVMCPVLWGDVSFPEPEAPPISDQLDSIGSGISDINSNISNTNSKLDQILHKLDLIYQKICEDEGGADLVPPDTIGLDPTAKQRVMSGMSGLDSTLDNVQPSDVNSSAVQGIGSFWGRVKGVLPSGLMSVYMLCLVGGIVSWIIYGKRGG